MYDNSGAKFIGGRLPYCMSKMLHHQQQQRDDKNNAMLQNGSFLTLHSLFLLQGKSQNFPKKHSRVCSSVGNNIVVCRTKHNPNVPSCAPAAYACRAR